MSEFHAPAATSGVKVGDHLTLGVRPQELRISPDGPLSAKVAVVERLGSETIVNCDLARP